MAKTMVLRLEKILSIIDARIAELIMYASNTSDDSYKKIKDTLLLNQELKKRITREIQNRSI